MKLFIKGGNPRSGSTRGPPKASSGPLGGWEMTEGEKLVHHAERWGIKFI